LRLLRKRLSFLLIPGSRGKTRQFSVSSGVILLSIFAVAALVIVDIFLAAAYWSHHVDDSRLERLQAENEMLMAKYNDMRRDIAHANEMYGNLVEKEIVIRNIFDLPEIDVDERKLGIGGPERDRPEFMSGSMELAYATETDIEALLRLAQFETEKYEEIYNTLAEKKSILDHTPSILPAKGYRTRGFGIKTDPFTGYQRFHAGIDISNKTGTPIYATADGVVSFVGRYGDLGKLITINHGYGFKTRYGHLSKIKVKKGQKISRGDLIGLMGSTGYSTGPHLHYEVIKDGKKRNPLEYILNN